MPEETILLVDSDSTSLSYLSHLLQGQQYKVFQTGLGKEGLIYAWRDHPNLILFDPALSDMSGAEFVKKLRRDTRTATVPILAISSDPTPQKKEVLLEAGATECLFKSGELVIELPSIIAHMLGKSLFDEKAGGFLMVFMSAKGGTGTSSLSVNYATSIAQHKPDASVVVVDLVLPLGSLTSIVGSKSKLDMVSIAEMPPEKINAEYFHKTLPSFPLWKFQLLPGVSHLERSNTLNPARIPEIVAALKAAYDYVIIDLGRSLSRISLPIIKQADLLAMIVNNDQSTVDLTKIVCEYLREQEIDSQNFYVILNRAVGLEGLTKPEIEEILGLEVRTTLPYMRGDFTLANNLNQPVTTKYPQASITFALKETSFEMITQVSNSR